MKKFYLINIICIVLVFALFIAFTSFFPRTYGYAEGENRNITLFPRFSTETYFEGKYTAQIADWYTDSIPYRYEFRDAVSRIKTFFGVQTDLQGSNVQEGAQDTRPESDIDYSLGDYNG